uniref:LEA type 2 family protein n=1 Tax=Treponema saccharophilum TaxID=165 RepID=UPI003864C0A7
MKTINAFLAGLVAAALSLAISCNTSSVLSSAAAKPTLNFDKVSIKSLDAEGITFNCNYSVKNPYPIGISLSKVAADVSCNSSKLTSISANEGVSISANKSKSNAFDFKIPYDSIISFAKTYKESKTLP